MNLLAFFVLLPACAGVAHCKHLEADEGLSICAPGAEEGADALLVTALDEVAWFLNLRGTDVSYNPVFLSYVLLTADEATLYVDEQKASSLPLHG